MADQTLPLAVVIIGVLAALTLAAFLIVRAERAHARALSHLARADERARADEARLAGLADDLRAAAQLASSMREERDALALTLARERADAKALEARIADLKAAKDDMLLAFNKGAGDLMKANSEEFTAQSTRMLDGVLKPLRDRLGDFEKSVGEARDKSAQQHGALTKEIELLSKQSASISKEAENLTRALKGNVQMQGAWGENILEAILNKLGLREGFEYSSQESFSGEEGRLRTDYIVNLPNGERLIIDSKVSLIDFISFTNAADDAAREASLAAHARSVRAHVRSLAAKNYEKRVGTRLDFVIMFVPVEDALAAALRHDQSLLLDATESRIAFATPLNLTATLLTIASMWQVERQNRHAENMAKRAGALYDQFVLFARDLDAIGKHVGASQRAYDDALKKLTSGKGNVVRQIEMIRELGAKTSRTMPDFLSDAASPDDPNDLLDANAGDPGELLRIARAPGAAEAAE